MGTYSFSGAPVFVTVATTGVYDINAFGGQGGNCIKYGGAGGNGAEEGGNITLTAGETLEIIVGQAGQQAGGYAGGGGGTFVLGNMGSGYQVLLVAGGGGGGYRTTGGVGTVSAAGNGSGGADFRGGGGSGVNSNGGGGASGGYGGSNRSGNYVGGTSKFGNGGFGGGGGGTIEGGGGGGGYTGGKGGAPGVGGTSFDSGTAIAAQTIAGANSGNGSLTITPGAVCFATGTLILTTRGDIAVERLAVGDLVVTASGAHRLIRWLGHRRHNLRRHPEPETIQPIRFRAGSLGDGLPRRDLRVSPAHAMRVGDALVRAIQLVNGASIVQESVSEVQYWHIELDDHDLVLAEGAQAETYLDTGNRSSFANAKVVTLRPNADAPISAPCLPYAEADAAIRARLIARAEAMGWKRRNDPAPWLEADGRRIDPVYDDGQLCRFAVPPGCGGVRLHSHAGRPRDVDPQSGEWRSLGLSLTHLALHGWAGVQKIPLDSPALTEGFHAFERTGDWSLRWTTGDALLPLAELMPGKEVTAVEIAYDSLPVWAYPEPGKAALQGVTRAAG